MSDSQWDLKMKAFLKKAGEDFLAANKGKDGVKTIEDFAGYAVDDLVGWKERKDGETKVFPGVLADHNVARADAEQMVLNARLKSGWISEDDLASDQEEEVAEAAGA